MERDDFYDADRVLEAVLAQLEDLSLEEQCAVLTAAQKCVCARLATRDEGSLHPPRPKKGS